MRYVTSFLAISALVAIAIFSVQNLETVEVSLLTWSIRVSLFLVIIAAYFLGMLTGWGLVDVFKRFVQDRRTPIKGA